VSSNLDVVRAGFAAYNAGDVDGLLAVCAPDVELVPLPSLLTGEPFRGHEGVREYLDAISDDWSQRAVELDRLIEAGDEVVLRGRFQARGRSSGVELDAPAAWVVTLRDGKVVRLRAYTDPEDALQAVGLRE
jgi:uncharacterized protein